MTGILLYVASALTGLWGIAAPSGSGLALTHCRGDGGSVCCRPAEMFGHPPIADDDHRVTPAVREVV